VRRARGFRTVTVIGPDGEILAYADRAAVRGQTIGLSGGVCAASMLSRVPGRRIGNVTLVVNGRPRLRLIGFSVSFPSGEQLLSRGVWAFDAAIGTFWRLERLRGRRARR